VANGIRAKLTAVVSVVSDDGSIEMMPEPSAHDGLESVGLDHIRLIRTAKKAKPAAARAANFKNVIEMFARDQIKTAHPG
jgi:hypothetical protein